MSPKKLITALALPENCIVNQRIPKTVLTAQAATSALDKRLIKQGIEILLWIAALKPDTIGVVAYKNNFVEYLEVSVLHVIFRHDAKINRLIELIHRAIPYPVLLIVEHNLEVYLSLAHKRWAQNDTERMVLEEGFPQTTIVSDNAPKDFFDHLAISNLPNTNMQALYSGWLDVVTALEAFYITGSFNLVNKLDKIPNRMAAIAHIKAIEYKISKLKKKAAKENQISRLVELNIKLKQLQATRQTLINKIERF